MSQRILFVDDKKDPSDYIFEGTYDVARSLHEAVDLMVAQKYDVLYLDYYLSWAMNKGPTGADVLRYVARKAPENIPAKVIGISGDPAMCDKVEALAEELRSK